MLTGVTDVETLQTWLSEARVAYRSLVTGKSVRVFVDQNGERIEYTAANAARLAAWIQEIQAAIDALQNGRSRPAGPLRFWFA